MLISYLLKDLEIFLNLQFKQQIKRYMDNKYLYLMKKYSEKKIFSIYNNY
jgi:hypothetical protein